MSADLYPLSLCLCAMLILLLFDIAAALISQTAERIYRLFVLSWNRNAHDTLAGNSRRKLAGVIRRWKLANVTCFPALAIYSRTVVRQWSYVRRSYAIDTAPFVIHETWRTSDWRKCERKSATYLHMSYDHHRRQLNFSWVRKWEIRPLF